MYLLVLKSARTCDLQSTPMVDRTTVMWKSRKPITWKAQVFEMPISRPMPAIHVTDLQISKHDFLPSRIFNDMVKRYKYDLAWTFKCGAWKNRSHEEILEGFSCKYAARYQKDRAGLQGPKVYLLEITGYTEGDVIHMNQVLKQAKQIQVACTERENGEDPAGDTEFAPVALTFHLSTQHAVRATLASQSENQQAQVNMAVGRINKLRVEVPRLIEVRQVIMPIQMSDAERLENITRAFMLVLTNRATDILDTMEIEENDTKGISAMWEKARTGARQCIVSVMEATAVTVGSERLCCVFTSLGIYHCVFPPMRKI